MRRVLNAGLSLRRNPFSQSRGILFNLQSSVRYSTLLEQKSILRHEEQEKNPTYLPNRKSKRTASRKPPANSDVLPLKYSLQDIPAATRLLSYQPPLGNTDHLPFKVVRSKMGHLPVYLDYKQQRTKVITILRKIYGDTDELKQELSRVLGGAEITERAGSLEVNGPHRAAIMMWLKRLGF
eukprot:TRINITY_DN22361_c0_g1_i1.p1 TRINITY_DN22361_c0_g1~~TRINITY_DN22361_c0_g1_i1.p1  ORF type:complete len:181 (+),score=31.90 TRINITY_DN22361_c0_g1_i1:7-549(+)